MYLYSRACSIEEVDTVTMTGGAAKKTQVTRYAEDGTSQSLPNLNDGRENHACGHYTTSDNAIVKTMDIGIVCTENVYIYTLYAGLYSGRRNTDES